jgi:signal transduction histidine kinase
MALGGSLCLCLVLLLLSAVIAPQNAQEFNTPVGLHQTTEPFWGLLQISSSPAFKPRLDGLHTTLFLLMAFALVAAGVVVHRIGRLRRQDAQQFQEVKREHERLEALVNERSNSLATLATHLQHVREEERGFLARELHDELGALLTAAKFDTARVKAKLESQQIDLALERLAHLNTTLNSGIALKRRMVEDLRPSSLANLGLVAALEILAREFSEGSRLQVATQLEEVPLSPSNALTVYRLVQESLTNIAKHAQAHTIQIELNNTPTGATVAVQDDGVGFDAESVKPTSHGLAGMTHRVTAAGGALSIRRLRPEGGTRVEAHLPF